MSELRLQKIIIDAVRKEGGFACKLSHRFMVGVPDLLVQHPQYGTSLWEVKWRIKSQSKRWFESNHRFILPLTELQKKFLRDYDAAGGKCGTISFLTDRTDLYMAAYALPVVSYGDDYIKEFQVSSSSHQLLKRGKREEEINLLLGRALEYYDEKLRCGGR